MARTEQAIFTIMCMISDGLGNILVQDRNPLNHYVLSDDFEDMVKVFESGNLSVFYYYKENGGWKMKLL